MAFLKSHVALARMQHRTHAGYSVCVYVHDFPMSACPATGQDLSNDGC